MSEHLREMQRQIDALAREVERLKTVEKAGPFYGGLDLVPKQVSHTIANGATIQPFTNTNNFAGEIILQDDAGGWVGLFLTGGGATALISDPSGVYAASNTGGKLCCYVSAGVVQITNNLGSSRTVRVTPFRTRTFN